MVNAGLFHNTVGGMAFSYLPINGNVTVSDGAMPNIMVAFAMPHKIAAIFKQKGSHFLFVIIH